MIKEALDEFVKAKAKKFGPERMETVGSSEVGLCLRRVFLAKAGHVPVEGSWGATIRGTTIEEEFWEPALRKKFGKKLLYSGKDQQTLRKGNLSSTPDGILVDMPRDCLSYLGIKDIGPDRSLLVECKSIDPRYDLREAKAENAFQVQCQLGLVREMTPHKPRYALITYTDASFWDDVEEFPIRFDPSVYKVAHKRANMVLAGAEMKMQDFRPEGWIAGGKECEYCPFSKPCGVERRWTPGIPDVEVTDQFVAEMRDLATEYHEAKDKEKADGEAVREVQEKIKERLREKGLRKVPGVVTWFPTKGRKSLDRDRLAADMAKKKLKLSDYEVEGDASDQLRVS